MASNGYFGNLVSDVNDVVDFTRNGHLKVYPNPARSAQVFIELKLDETRKISLNLTDMNGRIVKTVSSAENYSAGRYMLTLNVDDLANGYYTVNVISNQSIHSNKLIISK